ncbi:hypothetical protein IVB55_09800 [Bradyrhizobium sp. CW4]|uniref:hypothetical protein n=1 Tax=Bradyrhizobium sp. CW4 TaxID=2782687 RepID=UPI001FFBF204|nr:hypothetical protein [Bradyrhizobium sp. CW4]MCK1413281.1 hypothetical protein [Bradyrhizobium sp. CW4]
MARRKGVSRGLLTVWEIAASPAKSCGAVEIELNGARIRVEPGVELATLSMVLAALRGIGDCVRSNLKWC